MTRKLWENTRELHHACEEHVVGKAMSSGKPPIDWYASWLKALLEIHSVIDQHMPACVGRVDRLKADIEECGNVGFVPKSAIEYALSLTTNEDIEGAAYVLTGAHLMGGEIMRRRLEGYPTQHLQWEDRKESLEYLVSLREREDLTNSAKRCFFALLSVMDDIQ